VFGEQYTAKCGVVANPLPVCKWTREVFDLGGNESDNRLDDNQAFFLPRFCTPSHCS